MKVLVFENEKVEIENSFEIMNLQYYEGDLEFIYYPTSQDLAHFSHLELYDLVVIDIDLSVKSEKDGFAILEDIRIFDENILNKVLIITGSSQVRTKLDELGYKDISLLQKPIDYVEAHQSFRKFLN